VRVALPATSPKSTSPKMQIRLIRRGTDARPSTADQNETVTARPRIVSSWPKAADFERGSGATAIEGAADTPEGNCLALDHATGVDRNICYREVQDGLGPGEVGPIRGK
jgi:hypothetical protein